MPQRPTDRPILTRELAKSRLLPSFLHGLAFGTMLIKEATDCALARSLAHSLSWRVRGHKNSHRRAPLAHNCWLLAARLRL